MLRNQIPGIVETALAVGQFYVRPPCRLTVTFNPEETSIWEIFNGHLLGQSQTRQTKKFSSWNVFLELSHLSDDEERTGPSSPLISIKLDSSLETVFITRNILTRTWESYEPRTNIIESRPALRWLPELVATVDLANVTDRESAIGQVARGISFSLEGTSRLPITSVEAPLPDHALGQFAYFPGDSDCGSAEPIHDLELLLQRHVQKRSPRKQRASVLETMLRSADTTAIDRFARIYYQQWRLAQLSDTELRQTVIAMFNRLSLSPYTQLVNNWATLLSCWSAVERFGPEVIVDIVSYLLRHLVRHVTAYDLETFHNLGANYPDALLLDSMLQIYLEMIERASELFLDDTERESIFRVRRRALRQAWIVRKQYEGHGVPDRPTSPGENQRVLPESHPPVPEAQLMDPRTRLKKLYDGQSIESNRSPRVRRVLDQSILDLRHDVELFELGAAIYLDRPLGCFKQSGEVDRTILLSYEAFSAQIADARLQSLHRWGLIADEKLLGRFQTQRKNLCVQGVPVGELGREGRPGVVALEDAVQIAADFVFVRTTRSSLDEFSRQYDTHGLDTEFPELSKWLHSARDVLLIRRTDASSPADRIVLEAYDSQNRSRLLITTSAELPWSYEEQCGIETLRGMQIVPCDSESPGNTPHGFELTPAV